LGNIKNVWQRDACKVPSVPIAHILYILHGSRSKTTPKVSLERRDLNSMNLPADKVKLLHQYDNEKKWELVCDQERFQVKNPPSAYLSKLKSFLEQGDSRKFKRRVQESTQVLRELEISLRTNHIGYGQGSLCIVMTQCVCRFDMDSLDNGDVVPGDKNKIEKSVEDLTRSASNSPTHNATRAPRALAGRKALRNSRIVSLKDDAHVCIMCLRAIMNYQYGFNQVMTHPRCVNEITLSLNNKSPRTKAQVLELLAAVCLVRGGHDIILSALDNFKEVCGERWRFEKLMEYFCQEDSNIDFTVACMQFINIVVHSVENMNFRVHLQYEFTHLGLDDYLEVRTESERLQVQIQAYLDNVFDVGSLLEDAETKNALLEHLEEVQERNVQLNGRLQECEKGAEAKVSDLEKQLIQTSKEVELLKVNTHTGFLVLIRLFKYEFGCDQCWLMCERRHFFGLEPAFSAFAWNYLQETAHFFATFSCVLNFNIGLNKCATYANWLVPGVKRRENAEGLVNDSGVRSRSFSEARCRKPIQTKYRMPLFNWQALKAEQVAGTVFTELDDEHILRELNMDSFEEKFKTKAQSAPTGLGTLKMRTAQRAPSKVALMEPNRAKNLAITLRKGGMSASDICTAIETYDLNSLSLDFLELLERFIPSEHEQRQIQSYEREGRPLDELSEEDRFMARFGRIPRLAQRISTLTFMGNFSESVRMLRPQLDAVIAASMSIKSSTKLKKILEIILAFGNYMNSGKRGAAYGFRLQSLDLLLDTKSTDRKQTLLHFIVSIIQEKYPQLQTFYTELRFVDKASLGENILQDVRSLEKGMDVARKELQEQEESSVLRAFLSSNETLLETVVKDSGTAQEVYESAVEYFGENPKANPPSMFFPVFIRFIKAYKVTSSSGLFFLVHANVPAMPKLPHVDLIAELKKKQQVSSLVREGKDGAIEDIITGR
uniref:FMNL2 protein n=1 Tax=Denticeps clupeoides TaxID=299321 RepID=A0AAY3ZZS3_9TELE